MIDVDGFKGVNDSLGHLAGDQLLRDLSAGLATVAEKANIYRYGGDEFAVLLPGIPRSRAVEIGERLRAVACDMSKVAENKITISVGVASFPETAADSQELTYRADMAMYWAKSTGKNRVADWDAFLDRTADGPRAGLDVTVRGRQADVLTSLCGALAVKDAITRSHGERCARYTADLARELGLAEGEISALTLASLLHDLGKLVVPDEILNKPGPLDDDETHRIRRHPVDGMNMLTQVPDASGAVPAILHHHEHFDGSGYPEGLSGDQIPLGSRILLVTDAFDAMTTDRPYRAAMTAAAAIAELKRCSGTQFDPAVVEAFLRVLSRNETSAAVVESPKMVAADSAG
jgi:diguanylate cyclase (GGDEF)-like protein